MVKYQLITVKENEILGVFDDYTTACQALDSYEAADREAGYEPDSYYEIKKIWPSNQKEDNNKKTTKEQAIKELESQGYKKSHKSRCRGYVSRKNDSFEIEKYKGRFGEGFKIYTAAFDSTSYCFVTYFVK